MPVGAAGVLTTTAWYADVVPPHPPVIVYIILALPDDTPVTTPDELTVAIAVLLLLHAPVPPINTIELAVYVAMAPKHTGDEPVTEATLALGLMVTTADFDTVPPHPPLTV